MAIVPFQGETLCSTEFAVDILPDNPDRTGILLQNVGPYSVRLTIDGSEPTAEHGMVWGTGVLWNEFEAAEFSTEQVNTFFMTAGVRVILLRKDPRQPGEHIINWIYFQTTAEPE